MNHSLCLLGVALLAGVANGCEPSGSNDVGLWEGQVDSLPSGTVVVHNSGHGLWAEGEEWQLTEDFRIGSLEAEGPENFGRIASFAVDGQGRTWVIDSQANELRVFDDTGRHVRTIGRPGQGPGEFEQPVRVDIGPDGNAWVMDPKNTRLSVIDSAGRFLEGLLVPGGFVIMPWQGGFDRDGDYYAPVAVFEPEFRFSLGRFDREYTLLDTIALPVDPVERSSFDIVVDGRVRVSAGIPFQGGLLWRLSHKGTIWALITDQYRLMEFSPEGDTLRVITKVAEAIPVSPEERTQALDGMDWFTQQGGKIDASKIPQVKPLASSFFIDQQDFVWVARDEGTETRRAFEVFNPTGQYLGTVVVPFRLQISPTPVVKDDVLYGVARDALDVPYLVRGRIHKPKVSQR